MSSKVRISTKIWADAEFTSLTMQAQLIYFHRVITRQRKQFSVDECSDLGLGTPQELAEGAEILRDSKYGPVLNRVARRATLPASLKREVFAHDNWACVLCSSTEHLEIDHIFPLSKGGTDERENLQTLCRACNRSKGARL